MWKYSSELWQNFKFSLQNFNLFPSTPPTLSEDELRNQRISTRLFVILLILSLGILLLYTSLVKTTQTIHITAPTITQYSQLYSTYSQALTCPCTKISANYDTLLQINYTLHQVCSSVFITNYWIDYLATSFGNSLVLNTDFRWAGTFTFQGLKTLCKLVSQTIVNRMIVFYSTQYITASVIPLEVFESQMKALISQFRLTMTNDFLLSLSAIRDTTQTNALLTGGETNYQLYVLHGNYYIDSYGLSYGNCSCMSSATCAYLSNIYDSNSAVLFTVRGIYTGCYVLESLLQSNLQCFYDQICINKLKSYLYLSSSMNITALDRSLSSQFLINSTVEEILNELMIEEWNSLIMYDSYYDECKPIECSYTHETKNSVIYIVTTIVGLIGGLVTMLKLIVPRLIRFILFYIPKRKLRNNAVMPITES